MSSSTKVILLGLLLFVVSGAVASSFVTVQESDLRLSEHTVNAGEVTREVLVGQTFVARRDNLAGVAVKFATYSNRSNRGVIEFHLKESSAAATSLRVVRVEASQLRDNQFYRFRFEPIADNAKKAFFFSITAPDGKMGSAVTVDLDTRDPYHEGSAYIIRNDPELFDDPKVLQRSGKQTVDVVFATYHATSLRSATILASERFARSILASWPEKAGGYILWLELLAPVLAFGALTIGLRGRGEAAAPMPGRAVMIILGALFMGAVAFRLLLARQMPLTNDEGNYLYDAQSLLRGVVAGGDGYVKAPLVIAWVALWQFILGHTVLAGRVAEIVASSLMVVPLYFIGKAAWHQRAGLLAAAVWALMGAPAVNGIYVHTQSVALLFGAAGVALLWSGLRQREAAARWFVGAGLLLGLGVASRKSILALGLVPLWLILIASQAWWERIKRLLVVGLSFSIVVAALVGAAVAWYGCEDYLGSFREGGRCMGAEEVLGINSAEDGLAAVTPEEEESVRAYSLRGITPFFREALPLIFLSVIGWGLLLETALRRIYGPRRGQSVVAKLGWLLPAGVLWWAWSFFQEYEGAVFHELGGMRWLWYAMAAGLLLLAVWPAREGKLKGPGADSKEPVVKSQQPLNYIGAPREEGSVAEPGEVPLRTLLLACLLPALWVGGLVIFYMSWLKFHANYLVEFMPPLAVMSGVGGYLGWRRLRGSNAWQEKHPGWGAVRRVTAIIWLVILVWAGYLSNYVTLVYEHTGTFDLSAIREAADWARENIPPDERIFTGAAVVPYLSGHKVALDIAHPRWYAYEFTRKDPERLNTFLPSVEEMLAEWRGAKWFLLEQQTGFSFLMEYPEIEAGLETNWRIVHEVENLSNPLVFYQRIK